MRTKNEVSTSRLLEVNVLHGNDRQTDTRTHTVALAGGNS